MEVVFYGAFDSAAHIYQFGKDKDDSTEISSMAKIAPNQNQIPN